jgi:hypothetical protein
MRALDALHRPDGIQSARSWSDQPFRGLIAVERREAPGRHPGIVGRPVPVAEGTRAGVKVRKAASAALGGAGYPPIAPQCSPENTASHDGVPHRHL